MISIIIPTLNEEHHLTKTLEQLQTIKETEYECIISDGGSTDRTVEIAASFTPHVVVYQDKKRQTIAHARNLGAKQAGGEYLVFIDADVTIPNPDTFFKTILHTFAQDPALLAITTSVHVDKPHRRFADTLLFGLVNGVYYIINNILGLGAATGEFQMIRRRAFERIGGFNEKLVAYEDNEIFIRLAKTGKTRLLSNLTIYHSGRRVHKVGHLKLLFTWIRNGVWVTLFKKAFNDEWEPIR